MRPAAFLAALLLAAACSGPQVSVRRGFDFSKVRRVAVMDFSDLPGEPGSGEAVGGAFEQALLGAGYQVVERREVGKVLSEQAFAVSGAVDPQEARELGRILSVDALAFGVVTDFIPSREDLVVTNVKTQRREPIYAERVKRVKQGGRWVDQPQQVVAGYRTTRDSVQVPQTVYQDALVGAGVKLVCVDTGEVLWSGEYSRRDPSVAEAAQRISRRMLRAVRSTWPK